jgi:hypothetical protein
MRHPKRPIDPTPIPPPLRPDSAERRLTEEQKEFLDLISKAKEGAKPKPKKR